MAYDTGLEAMIDGMTGQWQLGKRKMFGGVAYFANGNMCFAVMGNELLFRVGKERTGDYLLQSGVHQASMGSRSMKDWLMAETDVVVNENRLRELLSAGHDFASTLPPKA